MRFPWNNLFGERLALSSRARALFFLLSAIFLPGCSVEDVEDSSGVSVRLVRQVRIELDSLTPFDIVPVVPYHAKGETYLFLTNPWNRSIDVYGVEAGKLIKRLVPRRGNDSNGEPALHTPRTCVVKSLDSILVFERGSVAEGLLINWAGEIVDDRPFRYFESGGPLFFNHGGRVLLHDDALYFKHVSLAIDLSDLQSARGVSFCYRYDLLDHRFEALPLYYPPAYLKRNEINFHAGVPQLQIVPHTETMVVNWGAKRRLEFWHLPDFSFSGEYEAHVSSWGKTLLHAPAIEDTRGGRAYDEQVVSYVYYSTVFYDFPRRLIYRMAFVPNREALARARLRESEEVALELNDIGIVVLDERGEKIGHVLLPSKKYWPPTSFVGREGLYLSKANVYRDDFDEDVLEFDVYVFDRPGVPEG